MTLNNNEKKSPKVHMSWIEDVTFKFIPLSLLKKHDYRFMFWSNNTSEEKPFGTHQNELLKYFKEGQVFHTFISGETMEGKGVFLENMAEYHLKESLLQKDGKKTVIIDVSGKNFEGCFWAKKYKCIFVYPSLLKARKKSTNPNVEEIVNKKNSWERLIRRAARERKVLVLMCRDPLESSTLGAQGKLFKTLTNDSSKAFTNIRKITLLREISFINYMQGSLKLTSSGNLTETKRDFLKLVRVGRHSNVQLISDAQRMKDIDYNLGDNVALKIYKRSESDIGDLPGEMKAQIRTLQKHQAICRFRGAFFSATIHYNEWHKKSTDSIEDLDVFPVAVDISKLNKFKENKYIDLISENWSNKRNRFIVGRRRHVQDRENSSLCSFELADILAISGSITISKDMNITNLRLIYGEVKLRNSEKHPKIETGDVNKTIMDLYNKNIIYDVNDKCYHWILDKKIINALDWRCASDEVRVRCTPVMITNNGAYAGAKSILEAHHIKLEIIKIPHDFFD